MGKKTKEGNDHKRLVMKLFYSKYQNVKSKSNTCIEPFFSETKSGVLELSKFINTRESLTENIVTARRLIEKEMCNSKTSIFEPASLSFERYWYFRYFILKSIYFWSIHHYSTLWIKNLKILNTHWIKRSIFKHYHLSIW